MKNHININLALTMMISAFIMIAYSSCTIEKVEDPNFPSIGTLENNASVDEMNNLVSGTLSGMRNFLDTYVDDCSIIGRDYYRISGADPRFTGELLGNSGSTLDNAAFYIVNPWSQFYRVVRNGWVLRHAVENTPAAITQEQKNGYLGFAKTMQALELLYASNMTYNNGIRTDVEDPNNMGPIVSYAQALIDIAALLDEGYTDLQNSGTEFLFTLSSGFDGFNTPAEFSKFNRGLKARVDVYSGNFSEAITDLSASFINASGDLYAGTYVSFSTASGDIPNVLYKPLNSVETDSRVVQESYVTDAEPGDARLSKASLRATTAQSPDSLSSNYDVNVWSSQDAPVSIIRNEELILISAEAKIQTGDLAGAKTDLDAVRIAAGLPAYAGIIDQASLTDEMLKQRRYSLFAEAHRWIDMRRYNRLDQLPIDRVSDDVWVEFPLPVSEF
ncbi:MAG: RagB/SusD family nutrient uptake outer membrane protein [Chitinophagales bacterium]